jgi:hypothetical protein
MTHHVFWRGKSAYLFIGAIYLQEIYVFSFILIVTIILQDFVKLFKSVDINAVYNIRKIILVNMLSKCICWCGQMVTYAMPWQYFDHLPPLPLFWSRNTLWCFLVPCDPSYCPAQPSKASMAKWLRLLPLTVVVSQYPPGTCNSVNCLLEVSS